MQYVDPYQLFGFEESAAQTLEASALRKARQRILAEFELQEDGFLEVGEFSYDKKSILDLLEAFEIQENRLYFLKIKRNSRLQNFLLGQDPFLALNVHRDYLNSDPAFAAFCSPYLAATCQRLLPATIQDRQWTEMGALVGMAEFMSQEDFEEGFKPLRNLIATNIIRLEEAQHDANAEKNLRKVPAAYDQGLIRQINRLEDKVQAQINQYSKALRRAANEMHKRMADVELAWLLISAACQLNAELSISKDNIIYRNRIQSTYDAWLRTQEGHNSHQSERVKAQKTQKQRSGRIGRGVKFILFAFVFYFIASFAYSFFIAAKEDKPNKNPFIPKPKTEVGKLSWIKRKERPRKTAKQSFQLLAVGASGLYASVKFAYEDIREGEEYAISRPKTGFNPYAAFCEQKTAEQRNKYVFKNNSGKDVVLLIDGGYGLPLYEARYVRNQEQTSGLLGNSFYKASLMNGEDWTDDLGIHQEKHVGGFTKAVDFIGSFDLENDSEKAPEVNFNYFSLEPITITLSFDGKRLRKSGGH